jgi:hypothetical protein
VPNNAVMPYCELTIDDLKTQQKQTYAMMKTPDLHSRRKQIRWLASNLASNLMGDLVTILPHNRLVASGAFY